MLREGLELPSVDNKPPFGLLDPFLALADRRDALEAEALKQDFGEQGAFADWFTGGFRRYPLLRRRAKVLPARMPKDSLYTKRVRGIGRMSGPSIGLVPPCLGRRCAVDH